MPPARKGKRSFPCRRNVKEVQRQFSPFEVTPPGLVTGWVGRDPANDAVIAHQGNPEHRTTRHPGYCRRLQGIMDRAVESVGELVAAIQRIGQSGGTANHRYVVKTVENFQRHLAGEESQPKKPNCTSTI